MSRRKPEPSESEARQRGYCCPACGTFCAVCGAVPPGFDELPAELRPELVELLRAARSTNRADAAMRDAYREAVKYLTRNPAEQVPDVQPMYRSGYLHSPEPPAQRRPAPVESRTWPVNRSAPITAADVDRQHRRIERVRRPRPAA